MRPFGTRSSLTDGPWEDWVNRVYLHVPRYLSASGALTSGGRQRKVRDLASLIKHTWGRECIILQKATGGWETHDPFGTPVIGFPVRHDAYGDPSFGRATSQIVRSGDAMLYVGGEDAWPFFVRGAKGYHVGVWWDGPFPLHKKMLTARRTEALFRTCRSVACVDTNVINWLRARGRKNLAPANRAVYIPNCADLNDLPRVEHSEPHNQLRLLFARRFEYKRGADLALDAVATLSSWRIPVKMVMSTAQGQSGSAQIHAAARARGIEHLIETVQHDLDTILSLYPTVDVALVPTLWSEGTSYACIEAIASGIPVVATTVGGLPNIVVPGFNGFVVQPTSLAFANAISAFAGDHDLWYAFHQNCLSMRGALSKDHWESAVLAWLRS